MITITTKNNHINYNPKNKIDEIVTNVGMILRVFKEEQPLNRDFALDPNIIDKNVNKIENEITGQLIKLFREYEPRAILKYTKLELNDLYKNDFDIVVGIEVVE